MCPTAFCEDNMVKFGKVGGDGSHRYEPLASKHLRGKSLCTSLASKRVVRMLLVTSSDARSPVRSVLAPSSKARSPVRSEHCY